MKITLNSLRKFCSGFCVNHARGNRVRCCADLIECPAQPGSTISDQPGVEKMLDDQRDSSRPFLSSDDSVTHGIARCGSERKNRELIKLGHGGSRAGAGRPAGSLATKPEPIPRWYVYRCEPHAERSATTELTRAGYTAYLPLIVTRRFNVWLRSYERVLMPRFPGYGFVELDPRERWLPVRESPGITEVLSTHDGRPSPLRAGEIEAHQADDARLCDLSMPPVLPGPILMAGAIVRIERGALAGMFATVTACDGVTTTAALELFGRWTPMRTHRRDVSEVKTAT